MLTTTALTSDGSAHHYPTSQVNLIINSFTVTAVALMCGEAHGIPVAGFCLQPTCIPSDDKDWHAIIPIDSGGDSLIDQAEKKLFTSHASLKPLRRAFNNWPFHNLSMPSLRAQFGLEASLHWKAVFKRRRTVRCVYGLQAAPHCQMCVWPASGAAI